MNRNRRGFTLIELLVVAGLIAVMFSLIVANGRPKPSALRTAQEFASMLLATQSRALGKPQGAAIIIECDPGSPRFGSVIHEGDTLPPIVIKDLEYGIHPDFPDLVTLKDLAAGNSTLLSNCYKFRYRRTYGGAGGGAREPVSPWLGLQVVRLQRASGGSESEPVGLPVCRESAGQTPFNTSYAPPGTFLDPPGSRLVNYEAEVIRFPTIGLNSSKVPPNLAIDLRLSGVGDDLEAEHGYGSFEGVDGAGMSPLAIVFDQVGRVSDVIQDVGARKVGVRKHDISASDVRSPPNPPPTNRAHLDSNFPSIEHPEWRDPYDPAWYVPPEPVAPGPIVPNEIIYFFFVDRDAIANDQSLLSDSAAWVAIDPLTGRISVSSNVWEAGNDLALARSKARAAVAFGK